MINVRSRHGICYNNNKVYVFCGAYTSQAERTNSEVYDIKTNVWTSIANSPFGTFCEDAQIGLDNNKLFIAFKREHSQYAHERVVLCNYNIDSNTYLYMGMGPFTELGGSVKYNNKIYYLEKADTTYSNMNIHWFIYNLETNEIIVRDPYITSYGTNRWTYLDFDSNKKLKLYYLNPVGSSLPTYVGKYNIRDLEYNWQLGDDNKKYSPLYIYIYKDSTVLESKNLNLSANSVIIKIPYPINDTLPFSLKVQLPSEKSGPIL